MLINTSTLTFDKNTIISTCFNHNNNCLTVKIHDFTHQVHKIEYMNIYEFPLFSTDTFSFMKGKYRSLFSQSKKYDTD